MHAPGKNGLVKSAQIGSRVSPLPAIPFHGAQPRARNEQRTGNSIWRSPRAQWQIVSPLAFGGDGVHVLRGRDGVSPPRARRHAIGAFPVPVDARLLAGAASRLVADLLLKQMATPQRPARISTSSPLMVSPRGAVYVLAGGLVAGTLDIFYACAFWALRAGVPPRRIFQSVAAGLLGPASFAGGARTAALGLALHFFIATSMSVTYYVIASRYVALHRRPALYGASYGLLLYGIMNQVVVPLSAAAPGSTDRLWVTLSIAVHMFLIGVPIALAARRGHLASHSG